MFFFFFFAILFNISILTVNNIFMYVNQKLMFVNFYYLVVFSKRIIFLDITNNIDTNNTRIKYTIYFIKIFNLIYT